MPASVTFVRHAETTANVARLWQGQTNTEFSHEGRRQLDALAKRMVGADYDVVVASDLGRTVGTAEATGLSFETDARWREIDVGEWEGLTYDQIRARDPERWAAFLEGEDIALGGGESVSDVRDRIAAAHRELVERIGPDGTALVVTHGLATVMAVHGAVGATKAMSIRVPANTALSTVVSTDPGTHRLVSYNDATHLGLVEPPGHDGETRIVLVRHVETEGNVARRWQGHADSPVTAQGLRQTEALRTRPPLVDVLYTSPTARARHTAEALGSHVFTSDLLREIGFGSWEGSTADEIAAADPDLFRRIHDDGEDVVRGGTGETFAGVRERMTRAIEGFVATHPGERIGVVSHGGSTRAYLSGVLGIEFPTVRRTLGSLENTGIAHIGYDRRGPALIAWNLAPHLV